MDDIRTPPTPLQPGDRIRIALPSVSGDTLDLGLPQWAGRLTVVWLAEAPSRDWLTALSTQVGAWRGLDVQVAVVAQQRFDPEPADVLALVDASGSLARLVGAAAPSLLVIDTGGRLAAVSPNAGLDQADAVVRRLAEDVTPVRVTRQAPVLLLDRVLEPSLCAELMAHWERGRAVDNDALKRGRGITVYADAKRRRDVVLNALPLFTAFRDRVSRRVLPEIARAFNVRLTQMEAPVVGCYDGTEGGWFRRHRDNTTPFTAHRLFAMSLNLNEAEFDGGEVWFPEYGRQRYCPPAGGAVVFSSSLLHEALPVTRGRRFGVFTFFHGDAGEVQVQKLIADERAAGRPGHALVGS